MNFDSMGISIIDPEIPLSLEDGNPDKSISHTNSLLTKFLFFLIGSSVSCIASTGRLTSKAFGTPNFIYDCYSVYTYTNLFAFLFILLFIECNYKKAIISGWICFIFHIIYVLISWFGRGDIGKYIYISVFFGISILEALIIQSNSYVVSKYYKSSFFSNLYSGYYGGIGIFSLIQTIIQHIVGTYTPYQCRICLFISHSIFASIIFFVFLSQTFIYFKTSLSEPNSLTTISIWDSCLKKITGMYKVLLSLPKYFSPFILFNLSDLCKCAFFQVFIPYRMLVNDTQLSIIFFLDNISDILGRSLASYSENIIVYNDSTTNKRRFFYRNIFYLLIPILSWLICFLVVWSTWTLKFIFLTKFLSIVIITVFVCFSIGYCSTIGINDCIPTLQYFNNIDRHDGKKCSPLHESYFSYVNDLNTFLIKLFWVLVFLGAFFIGQVMERHQSTPYYQELKHSLDL